jgi:hypothetical protein
MRLRERLRLKRERGEVRGEMSEWRDFNLAMKQFNNLTMKQ